ncbi:SIS domain-containing protein [Methanoculleus sp. FWC-SCC1]|uniref:SIS domain-containing protein n=2 Tax=Methanoculleus frigidifontis TaxID=2584085 RepID=A0ABT8MBQ2_9EURY|nr:SIS domain-containing protein [Methanoculleus sp. FWC-SCC1]
MKTDCFSILDLMLHTASRVEETARLVDQDEAARFLDEVISAKRIYVVGAGRSGLVAKAFAMRLMHLGFESYVVGETITPAFTGGDLLAAFSGSGETKSVVETCEIAHDLGGRIALVTATPESSIGRIADTVVTLGENHLRRPDVPHDFEVRQLTGQYRSASATATTPAETIFETAALVFADAIVAALMEVRHCTLDEIKGRWANVQ